jgi:hypothetical protein
VKDSLNGVSLNLEVIRSRSSRMPGGPDASLAAFATAASEQLELLSLRAEAVLFLARPARDPADVAVTLKHLAALLIPATKADGGRLTVEGHQRSAPTTASAQGTRLALAGGLLALIKEGGGSCRLETGGETVVRFSHESAATCTLDKAIASAIVKHRIRTERSDSDLILRFPG